MRYFLTLAVALFSSLPAHAQGNSEQLKAECGHQAGFPFGSDKDVKGPHFVDIDANAALPACLAAAKAAPQDPLVMYQLARALRAAKKYGQARSAYELAISLAASSGAPAARAPIELGAMLARGEGGAPDPAAARKLYETAVGNNALMAMALLGAMYESGTGGAKDLAQAQSLYGRAIARQMDFTGGNRPGAIFFIGFRYTVGEPIKDYAQAKVWFEKSANGGYGFAAGRLGMIYEEGGYGLTRDVAEAKRWYQKGAQAHDDDSVKALQRLGGVQK
ncbi:MAG TPA: tetratricopeptide repeat protein [Xanthobacteraceae bacterium]|jgi:TPR repeat protein|nr:tetratricopeptide repeat protein [Xanthobacteraceae bacterium]